MQYVRLGDTGLVVSRLAFGAMTFGSAEGAFASIMKVDRSGAQAMLDRCLEAGINFFDTADGYANGQSEEMLGELLGSRRDQVVIATKAFFRRGPAMIQQGLSRRALMAALQASLKRLKTDYVDLYLCHSFDPHTPLEETLDTLNDMVRAGMVRYLGYSNWSAWQAAKAVGMQRQHGWARFVAAQMYYSLVGRDLEHEVLPFVQDAGIGTMIWSPLAGGLLSGKYNRESLKDQDNRLSGFDFLPDDKEKAFEAVEAMRAMAAERRASVAQIALAWLLHQPGVSTVLIGASRLSQLEDNLGAAGVRLSPADLEQLNRLTAPTPLYPGWFQEKTRDTAVAEALQG